MQGVHTKARKVGAPECFPYSVGRQNKLEPHDLQKYTVLNQLQHPRPKITKEISKEKRIFFQLDKQTCFTT